MGGSDQIWKIADFFLIEPFPMEQSKQYYCCKKVEIFFLMTMLQFCNSASLLWFFKGVCLVLILLNLLLKKMENT